MTPEATERLTEALEGIEMELETLTELVAELVECTRTIAQVRASQWASKGEE